MATWTWKAHCEELTGQLAEQFYVADYALLEGICPLCRDRVAFVTIDAVDYKLLKNLRRYTACTAVMHRIVYYSKSA